MTLIEVKKAAIGLLREQYPDCYFYSMAVQEEYKRPSFFTQIKPIAMSNVTRNLKENVVVLYINYMQEKVNEADMLRKADEIRNLFGTHIKVCDRAIDVGNIDFDFVGTNRNILDMSIELQWFDKIEHVNNQPLMMSVETNIKNMEE